MNVLVISVHPDDETLGCGGTILKHVDAGDKVFWLIVTSAYKEIEYSESFLRQRQKQIQEVAKEYGFKQTYLLGFPTTRLHEVDFNELIAEISRVVMQVKPEIVYSVNRADIHTDHQITAKAVASCTKNFRYPFIKRILIYECLSETEMAYPLLENIFLPNAYCDITEYFDNKVDIFRIYKSEVQKRPYPRSVDNIKALGILRGSTIGVKYAEAFMIVRDIF